MSPMLTACKRTLLYSGVSYTRAPEIQALQLKGEFIWKHNFYTLVCPKFPEFRVLDLNRTVEFNGTQIYIKKKENTFQLSVISFHLLATMSTWNKHSYLPNSRYQHFW